MDFVGSKAQNCVNSEYQCCKSNKTEQINDATCNKFINCMQVGAVTALDNIAITMACTKADYNKKAAANRQKSINAEQQKH